MAFLGIGVLATPTLRRALGVGRLVGRLPFQTLLAEVRAALALYRDRPVALLVALATSVLNHAVASFTVWLLARALGIEGLELGMALALVPVANLFAAIPLLPGGWGVGELAFAYLFGQVGIPATEAVGLSVVYRLSILAASLPGGVLWLFWKDRPDEGGDPPGGRRGDARGRGLERRSPARRPLGEARARMGACPARSGPSWPCKCSSPVVRAPEAPGRPPRRARRARFARRATDDFHLTVQFLGNTAEEDVPGIGTGPGGGGGGAGRVRRPLPGPRGLSGAGAGTRGLGRRRGGGGAREPRGPVAGAWARRSSALGYPPERRAWHPHVTLGRLRSRPSPALVEAVEAGAGVGPRRGTGVGAETYPFGSRESGVPLHRPNNRRTRVSGAAGSRGPVTAAPAGAISEGARGAPVSVTAPEKGPNDMVSPSKRPETATKEQRQRQQALDAALGQIEKQYGKGSIMSLGRHGDLPRVDGHLDAAACRLDLALGGGGVPRGRIIEIYGPESSGKTTLCSHVIANAQKAGGVVRVHRRGARLRRRPTREEPRRQPRRAARLAARHGEQALEIAETLVRSNAVDVVVIDSVAALVPQAEIEGEMGDTHVGLQARLMSQALRKLTGAIRSVEHRDDLHQPDPHEDRRHVRQPRDDHGRQRAQVLRLGAARHAPHRLASRTGRRGRRQPRRA